MARAFKYSVLIGLGYGVILSTVALLVAGFGHGSYMLFDLAGTPFSWLGIPIAILATVCQCGFLALAIENSRFAEAVLHLFTNRALQYNSRMCARGPAIVVLFSAGMFAQSTPPSCPADRPVDDIITEVHKQESKKKHRNPNPLPDFTCIWGWCHDEKRTPQTFPDNRAQATNPSGNEGPSSVKVPVVNCNDAMEMALKAAHNVEVGDYSFAAKNYNGAVLRYQQAVEEKAGDAAIHVRLGRVFEKLDLLPQAMEQYKAAQELAGPPKWSDEAKAAVLRLEHGQPSGKH